jgi:hypothetical protein
MVRCPTRCLGLALLLTVSGAGRAHAEGAAPRPLDLRLAGVPGSQPASQPARPAAFAAPPPARLRPVEQPTLWRRYQRFWDAELERIIGLDLWGTTTQLPKGYLTVKYQYNQREAVGRFDKDGNKLGRYDANGNFVPAVIPPIGFGDAASGKPCLDQKHFSDCLLAFDAGARGRGGSNNLQVSYGLTGRLDWYVDVPMQFHHVSFSPQVIALDPLFAAAAGTGMNYPIDASTYDPGFTNFIQKLGRPKPKLRADHELALGDINTGFSWNFLRTKWLSTAVTYRLYLPTAYVADPNNSMVYFTGPDVDAGNRAWAMGAGLGHDFRLPRFIHKNVDLVVSWEWNFSYAFPSQRDYPNVCPAVFNMHAPDGCDGFRPPDAAASALFDPQHQAFPDLSHMRDQGSTFTYTPGFAMDMSFSLNANLWGLGVAAGLGQAWAQKPEVDGDPNFIAMINNLELIAHSRATLARFAVQLPLFPLYLPAVVSFQYEYNITGANFIYYKNNFQITVQGYIPDAALVTRH